MKFGFRLAHHLLYAGNHAKVRIFDRRCFSVGTTQRLHDVSAPGGGAADRIGTLHQNSKEIGGGLEMATATKTKPSTTLKLQPLGDRVVVKREASEGKTAGGILLPDTAKDKPARGTISSVGNGKLLDDGRRSQLQVRVGDRVVFHSYAGEVFQVGDEELLLMREDDILAVIE